MVAEAVVAMSAVPEPEEPVPLAEPAATGMPVAQRGVRVPFLEAAVPAAATPMVAMEAGESAASCRGSNDQQDDGDRLRGRLE